MLLEPSAADAESLLPPIYRVEVIPMAAQSSSDLLSTLDCLSSPLGAIPSQTVRVARVLANQRLTSEGHFQDTRKITLGFESSASFVAGDVLMVQPRNPDAIVIEYL